MLPLPAVPRVPRTGQQEGFSQLNPTVNLLLRSEGELSGDESPVCICQNLPASGITCGREKIPSHNLWNFFSAISFLVVLFCGYFLGFFLFDLNLFPIIAWRVLSCHVPHLHWQGVKH